MKPRKGNLQVTPEGHDRYYDLVDILRNHPHPQLKKEFNALQYIVHLHPLDYVFPKSIGYDPAKPTTQDFKNLIREGYAKIAEDNYETLIETLKTYDPELLPIFQTYKKLAYEESLSESEISDALRLLGERMFTEEATLKMQGPFPDLWKSIGSTRTKSQKALALDNLINKIHYDPDLLRKLPRREQTTVANAILNWLDQLAGAK